MIPQVLSTSFLNFFSSLIFVQKILPLEDVQMTILITVNCAMICVSFSWCMGGMILDFFNFGRFLWHTTKKEIEVAAPPPHTVQKTIQCMPILTYCMIRAPPRWRSRTCGRTSTGLG